MSVDFIIDDVRVALEAKATRRVQADYLKGKRSLVEDHPRAKKRILASLEPRRRVTEDGILILPAKEFAKALWAGEILQGNEARFLDLCRYDFSYRDPLRVRSAPAFGALHEARSDSRPDPR